MKKQILVYRHQKYLEAVLAETDNFNEVNDIITRHATLAATNAELRQQQQMAALLTEQLRCRKIFSA